MKNTRVQCIMEGYFTQASVTQSTIYRLVCCFCHIDHRAMCLPFSEVCLLFMLWMMEWRKESHFFCPSFVNQAASAIQFLDQKVPFVSQFFSLKFLFALFLYFCCSCWPSTSWACFQFKNSWKSTIQTGNSCHWVAMVGWRKFFSKFFTQISEHFCVFFLSLINSITLNWVSFKK